jgi:hypothetical protein
MKWLDCFPQLLNLYGEEQRGHYYFHCPELGMSMRAPDPIGGQLMLRERIRLELLALKEAFEAKHRMRDGN